ncbi:MAG: PDZ domain-containing protein [Planctomycetota bacterium]|nr:MAG: PDZ domain-containing protein [Planctomycetota bacterium]
MKSRNAASLTWLMFLCGLLLMVVLDVPGRLLVQWAHAVERGRIQADSEELARVEEVSHAFRLVSRVAQAGVVSIDVRPSDDDMAEYERLRRRIGELDDQLEELQESFELRHDSMDREQVLELFEKIRTRRARRDELEERRAELRSRLQQASGSGIIYDEDGHVLTNNHVVDGAGEVYVRLPDEREVVAARVGVDPETDLALLKVSASGLHPLPFGDSDQVEVGDWVLAVGAPFGLSHSVTHGIISARGRTNINTGDRRIVYQDFLQTDAAINPGNSGGPLLNLRGEVIGVNTAIATNGDSYNAGIAFTIPSNTARKIAEQLKNSGDVERGWLGVTMIELETADREVFNTPDGGVMIGAVLEGTPAHRAGLQVEDVVVAINDTPVRTQDQMLAVIADIFPGEKAQLDLVRNGRPVREVVKLGRRPEDTGAVRRRSEQVETIDVSEIGIQTRTLRPAFASQLGLKNAAGGAIVVGVQADSASGVARLRPGDVIVEFDGRRVTRAAQLAEWVEALRDGVEVHLRVLDDQKQARDVTITKQ